MNLHNAVYVILNAVTSITRDLSFDQLKKVIDVIAAKMSEDERLALMKDLEEELKEEKAAKIILAGIVVITRTTPTELTLIASGVKNESN